MIEIDREPPYYGDYESLKSTNDIYINELIQEIHYYSLLRIEVKISQNPEIFFVLVKYKDAKEHLCVLHSVSKESCLAYLNGLIDGVDYNNHLNFKDIIKISNQK